MTTYVHRPDHPLADEFGMIDVSIAPPLNRQFGRGPAIISDIMEPTRHMATGRFHTSKSEFRKDTRASGCVEVGNDPQGMPKPRKFVAPDRKKRREDIKRALDACKAGTPNATWGG